MDLEKLKAAVELTIRPMAKFSKNNQATCRSVGDPSNTDTTSPKIGHATRLLATTITVLVLVLVASAIASNPIDGRRNSGGGISITAGRRSKSIRVTNGLVLSQLQHLWMSSYSADMFMWASFVGLYSSTCKGLFIKYLTCEISGS